MITEVHGSEVYLILEKLSSSRLSGEKVNSYQNQIRNPKWPNAC